MARCSQHQSKLYRAMETRCAEIIAKRIKDAWPTALIKQKDNILSITWPNNTLSVAMYIGTRKLLSAEQRQIDHLAIDKVPCRIFKRVDEDLT